MIEKEVKCRCILDDEGKVIEMLVEIDGGNEMLFEFRHNVGKISLSTFSEHDNTRKVCTSTYRKIAKQL